jgi:hypothetical protein
MMASNLWAGWPLAWRANSVGAPSEQGLTVGLVASCSSDREARGEANRLPDSCFGQSHLLGVLSVDLGAECAGACVHCA